MKLRSALVAAGLLALPAAAMAQPVDGLYVGAGAGYTYTQDWDVRSGAGSGGHLQTNGGVIGLASVGYGLGNGFRLELQGDYRNYHQHGTGSADGVRAFNQTYGAFVNGLFDFDVGADVAFPYVGIGFGWEETNLKGSVAGVSGGSTVGSPAGQAILGVAFPIPDVPGLSVTAEYRFMATFEDEKFSSPAGASKLGQQYNHSGLLGLRYAFGVEEAPAPAPMPAPVAAPAPAPARTYLVFFDWDKYNLSTRATQIIAEAASNAGKVKVTRIEVNGYADLSGSHAYNLPLSQRRADAVAAELVKDGIPKSEIFETAFGDSHPLVPTAPGVREPQNRRVEIILK